MDNVTFSITSYNGHETDVLRLRNNNREYPQTPSYMTWRYLGQASPYPPLIFWASLHDNRVGMAAIIFRPYWVDHKLHHFAVLGDISVDINLRGKGIGKKLLHYVTSYLRNQSYCCSFTIPNPPIKHSLLSIGWITPEPFVWYVWTVDPVPKITQYVKIALLVNVLDIAYRTLGRLKLTRIKTAGFELQKTDIFDDSFDEIWRQYKKDGITRDRSAPSLRWRYQTNPNKAYEVMKFISGNMFVGYVVYEFENGKTCYIADILTLDVKYIRPAVKLFVREICKTKNIQSIRCKLNANHPYGIELRKIGFQKRNDNDVFQVLVPPSFHESGPRKWYVTRGDKDT